MDQSMAGEANLANSPGHVSGQTFPVADQAGLSAELLTYPDAFPGILSVHFELIQPLLLGWLVYLKFTIWFGRD